MGKNNILTVILLFIGNLFYAQSQAPRYWISFADKLNSTYSIANPQDFLSQRAIDRREKMGIAIIENDLPVSLTYIDSVRNAGNVNILYTSKWLNGVLISTRDTIAMQQIQNFPFVLDFTQVKSKKRTQSIDKFSFEKQTKSKVQVEVVPNYPYGYTFSEFNLHHGQVLHDLSFKGQGMHIALLDAGFYKGNELEALQHVFDDGRLLSTYDFVDKEESVFEDNYHGCAVWSIMAGRMDGIFMGSAPLASYHLLRTEDAFSESLVEEYNWVAGAEYADSAGVDIINSSLGYTVFDDSTQDHTYADMDGNTTIAAIGADIAASKGILVFVSAGNQGGSAWQVIGTPADADSILAVGAVDSSGSRAWFSSTGPSYDGDIKPNIASVGWNKYYINPFDSRVSQGNGTSFSSPFIAGFAACLWQSMPTKTAMEIKQIIEASSSQYNSPDSLIGFGIPDFQKALEGNSGFVYQEFTTDKIEITYPLPTNEQLNIVYHSSADQTIYIQLIDINGKIVVQENTSISSGRNLIRLSMLNQLSSGVYTLRVINSKEELINQKVVVSK